MNGTGLLHLLSFQQDFLVDYLIGLPKDIFKCKIIYTTLYCILFHIQYNNKKIGVNFWKEMYAFFIKDIKKVSIFKVKKKH